MKFNSVIVRYGEITLKGRNRGQFEQQLRRDVEGHLQRCGRSQARILLERGRMYILGLEDCPDLRQVLGIHSYSPALVVERDLEVVRRTLRGMLPLIREKKSFRVSCQRVDKTFLPDSVEVAREMGAFIHMATQVPVDLTHPEITVHIEISQRGIYLFHDKIKGYAGFPFGSAGKLVSLISGGIDSPVATFLMMKRGVEPILLHFTVSPSDEAKVEALCDKLQEYAAGRTLKLVCIPREEIFKGKFHSLFGTRHEPYICVMCKYLMHKAAADLVEREGALGIVTGDNLAQVASQTLKNLLAQRMSHRYPVYSPLIALEKNDIIALAREIGTYDLSIAPAEGCTPPHNPKTGADPHRLYGILQQTGLE